VNLRALAVMLGALSGLGVAASVSASDAPAINAKVRAALRADLGHAAKDIQVDSFGGTVQLSGTVDSRSTGDRAIRVATDVAGVNHVENALVRD
jgi:osmotically-inducible protein OsmY